MPSPPPIKPVSGPSGSSSSGNNNNNQNPGPSKPSKQPMRPPNQITTTTTTKTTSTWRHISPSNLSFSYNPSTRMIFVKTNQSPIRPPEPKKRFILNPTNRSSSSSSSSASSSTSLLASPSPQQSSKSSAPNGGGRVFVVKPSPVVKVTKIHMQPNEVSNRGSIPISFGSRFGLSGRSLLKRSMVPPPPPSSPIEPKKRKLVVVANQQQQPQSDKPVKQGLAQQVKPVESSQPRSTITPIITAIIIPTVTPTITTTPAPAATSATAATSAPTASASPINNNEPEIEEAFDEEFPEIENIDMEIDPTLQFLYNWPAPELPEQVDFARETTPPPDGSVEQPAACTTTTPATIESLAKDDMERIFSSLTNTELIFAGAVSSSWDLVRHAVGAKRRVITLVQGDDAIGLINRSWFASRVETSGPEVIKCNGKLSLASTDRLGMIFPAITEFTAVLLDDQLLEPVTYLLGNWSATLVSLKLYIGVVNRREPLEALIRTLARDNFPKLKHFTLEYGIGTVRLGRSLGLRLNRENFAFIAKLEELCIATQDRVEPLEQAWLAYGWPSGTLQRATFRYPYTGNLVPVEQRAM